MKHATRRQLLLVIDLLWTFMPADAQQELAGSYPETTEFVDDIAEYLDTNETALLGWRV